MNSYHASPPKSRPRVLSRIPSSAPRVSIIPPPLECHGPDVFASVLPAYNSIHVCLTVCDVCHVYHAPHSASPVASTPLTPKEPYLTHAGVQRAGCSSPGRSAVLESSTPCDHVRIWGCLPSLASGLPVLGTLGGRELGRGMRHWPQLPFARDENEWGRTTRNCFRILKLESSTCSIGNTELFFWTLYRP